MRAYVQILRKTYATYWLVDVLALPSAMAKEMAKDYLYSDIGRAIVCALLSPMKVPRLEWVALPLIDPERRLVDVPGPCSIGQMV